jgi:hypothetical protein
MTCKEKQIEDRIALRRADAIIKPMLDYIGKMALPAEWFYNLNEHFLYLSKLEREKVE